MRFKATSEFRVQRFPGQPGGPPGQRERAGGTWKVQGSEAHFCSEGEGVFLPFHFSSNERAKSHNPQWRNANPATICTLGLWMVFPEGTQPLILQGWASRLRGAKDLPEVTESASAEPGLACCPLTPTEPSSHSLSPGATPPLHQDSHENGGSLDDSIWVVTSWDVVWREGGSCFLTLSCILL